MSRIAIIGPDGKMGKELVSLCKTLPNIEFAGSITREQTRANALLLKAEVLIDFTLPEALESNLNLAIELNVPIVIGTTGLDDKQKKLMLESSKKIPLFYSPNFSLGIALTKSLAKKAVAFFDQDLFIDIVEKHHTHKKDAPSGTAILLGDAMENKANIHSIRAPNIVGEHSILFSKEDESIEITHKAKSRAMFAKGAIEAALFLKSQKIGYYTMDDLVKEKNGNCLSGAGR